MAVDVVALLLLAACAGGADAVGVTASTGSPREYPSSESDRAAWFRKLHGQWPPPRTYPGGLPREESESPGWRRHMEDFEAEARSLAPASGEHDWRWERWLELAQMRLAKNYSAKGWMHTRLDSRVHAGVLGAWQEASSKSDLEDEGEVGFYISGDREFWDIDNLEPGLHERLIADVQSRLAAWVGIPDPTDLQLNAAYGLRSYLNGSVLKPHVDLVTTHVLSAIYCVEVRQPEGSEPWLVGTEVDFSGQPAWVDLRDGELFLYESAKLPHGRPTTFVGTRYTAIFMHFEPPDWNLENYDRVYAVPPDYDSRRPRNPPAAEL
mmetsp:Transcript_68864/g.204941  ORF Transcript_68864/g.204941 Transcript_68864/m.204941 type:complete len:322 (+) Transcript_68864:69-1034(+)